MARKRKAPEPNPIPRRFEVSAGGIVWRDSGGNLEVVMVRPAGRKVWTLPKGQPAEGETMIETAARETHEETGLIVEPSAAVGQISYVFSWRDSPEAELVRIVKRVHYFLMEPRGGDLGQHDSEIEEARWVPLSEAAQLAEYKGDRAMINRAAAMLKAKDLR